ncbi:CBS domain-containing protein [Thalassoglobus polymorphus]|uniref:Inosine 5'-monophosphate dehydrogenase n=1 Tax=Thalassoglobus polymorphus TaxID=2527994 RepID=A0A517QUP2_9PLAN|nr:CBS domain-containing protein [Thalassoglobus polymorphus]QDT35359.1 inosine 5'-monophosphate dehydrogenase [Thalassoglobus polymorphus]
MPQLFIQSVIDTHMVTVLPETKIEEAENLLLQSKVSDVYIVNEQNALVGVVPDYDFLKYHSLRLCPKKVITTIMSPVSKTLSLQDSFEKAFNVLCENIHPRVPVVDQTRLIGTISRLGLISLLLESEFVSENASATDPNQPHPPLAGPKYLKTGGIGGRHIND